MEKLQFVIQLASGVKRGRKWYNNVSISFRSFVFPRCAVPTFAVRTFSILCAFAFICWGAEASYAEEMDADKASYAAALAYCRGNVSYPTALRSDRKVLCLDGKVEMMSDLLQASGLEQGGLFVVRSLDGDPATTMTLADMLLTREATVIVNQYCLAICANYLFIASLKTFVPRDALVAWTSLPIGWNSCAGFRHTGDDAARRFDGSCELLYKDSGIRELIRLQKNFYQVRTRAFATAPVSVTVGKILKRKFDMTGEYPNNVYWTWNPRFYANALRARILYEAYPESQDDVDAIVARLGLRLSVIYDP